MDRSFQNRAQRKCKVRCGVGRSQEEVEEERALKRYLVGRVQKEENKEDRWKREKNEQC